MAAGPGRWGDELGCCRGAPVAERAEVGQAAGPASGLPGSAGLVVAGGAADVAARPDEPDEPERGGQLPRDACTSRPAVVRQAGSCPLTPAGESLITTSARRKAPSLDCRDPGAAGSGARDAEEEIVARREKGGFWVGLAAVLF